MEVGQLIKYFRKKRKLTQVQLSKLIGKSVRTLQKYESGEIKDIPFDTLLQIGEALEFNLAGLLDANTKIFKRDSNSNVIEYRFNKLNKSLSEMKNNTEEVNTYLFDDIFLSSPSLLRLKNIYLLTKDLPDEAIKEIESFTQFIKNKYSTKKEGE